MLMVLHQKLLYLEIQMEVQSRNNLYTPLVLQRFNRVESINRRKEPRNLKIQGSRNTTYLRLCRFSTEIVTQWLFLKEQDL